MSPHPPLFHDYLVLGAGPAGLQLGHHLQELGCDYAILESGGVPGTFFSTYPRHRTLISINKAHTGCDDPEVNLRFDWNSLLSSKKDLTVPARTRRFFPSADTLVDYLGDYARELDLNIHCGVHVVRVSKRDDEFRLEDSSGNIYRCRRLIIATGISKPNIPNIPGIELSENYATMSVDPEDFLNQRVLILGKGNSAFETADNLMETTATTHIAGPKSIKLAWRSHYVGDLRAINNNFLDTYQLKSQNAIIDADITRIQKSESGKLLVSAKFVRAGGVIKQYEYDRVLVCTGFLFDDAIFDDSARPKLAIGDRYPDQTPEWESTNVEGMFFAGVLTQMRSYKKSTSAFIHGFRYNVRALSRIIGSRFEGRQWPTKRIPRLPEEMMKSVIARVNRSSALWQQFGYLCDVLQVPTYGAATYQEEMPVDLLMQLTAGTDDNFFAITLEYGPDHDKVDPFDVNVARVKQSDATYALDSQYLHPVVRHYRGNELLSEHHIVENLENEWFHEQHTAPLEAYFRAELTSDVCRADSVVDSVLVAPALPPDSHTALA